MILPVNPYFLPFRHSKYEKRIYSQWVSTCDPQKLKSGNGRIRKWANGWMGVEASRKERRLEKISLCYYATTFFIMLFVRITKCFPQYFTFVVPFHSANNSYEKEKYNANQQNRDNLSQISGLSFNSGGGISQSSSRNNTLERKRYQPEKPLAVPEVDNLIALVYKRS